MTKYRSGNLLIQHSYSIGFHIFPTLQQEFYLYVRGIPGKFNINPRSIVTIDLLYFIEAIYAE